MQGPFSEELNLAMLRQIRARWLVTKASGAAGGFQEKLAAARRAGARVVVIRRPREETGLSLRELAEKLTGMRRTGGLSGGPWHGDPGGYDWRGNPSLGGGPGLLRSQADAGGGGGFPGGEDPGVPGRSHCGGNSAPGGESVCRDPLRRPRLLQRRGPAPGQAGGGTLCEGEDHLRHLLCRLALRQAGEILAGRRPS